MPFLQSVIHFVGEEEDTESLAVKAQIETVLTVLQGQTEARYAEFIAAINRLEPPSELRKYNDLYVLTGVDQLPGILLGLKVGSEARAYALLVGLASSRAEYYFHRRKPAHVPKRIPPVVVKI